VVPGQRSTSDVMRSNVKVKDAEVRFDGLA